MPKAKTPFAKKELKKFVNENGFFCSSMKLDLSKNAPTDLASQIPEGASYFEGIVSNGELNRNGYIIRPKALIDSLGVFMMNPVVLLGHDTDEPIGRCLNAVARGADAESQEIFVQGYVFDDLTDGRFARGLLQALSTGHITREVEFENIKTGEVLSKEEFMKFNWEEQCSGDWVMAVTKLEWVEFSVVSIGSNRKSLITRTNAIEAFFKSKKFCENSLREIVGDHIEDDHDEQDDRKVEGDGTDFTSSSVPSPSTLEAKVEDETKKEEAKTETSTEDKGAENAGETTAAAAEEPAEKSGEGEGAEAKSTEGDGENKVRISKADREKLQAASDLLRQTLEATIAAEEGDEKAEEVKEEKKEEAQAKVEEPAAEKPKEALPAEGEEEPEGNAAKIEVAPQVRAALETLVSINTALTNEVAELKMTLSKIPNRKGLAIVTQFSGEKKEENKPAAGEALMSLLRDNGFNV